MSDRPDQETTRPSLWSAIERRRKLGIIAAGLALVAAIAGAAALSATRPSSNRVDPETTGTITPAQETTATTVTVPSYAETPTADPGDLPGSPAAGVPPASAPGRAPVVAYRRDGWLCVAAEDGSGERRVAESAAGVFTLAPDGTTIAYVDSGSGSLALANVATGAVTAIGAATQDPPSWVPNSGWLVYTAPGPNVRRVTRDGVAALTLFAGSIPSVSPSGAIVVGLTPSGEIAVWRNGSASKVRATGVITGLACDDKAVLYGASTPESGAAQLRSVGLDGRGDRAVVSGAAASRAVTFGKLLLSPNAQQFVYAELGDDGYSRLFAVPTAGGTATSLSVRRDCYPLRWTADGTSVLFIEGNAIQGEPTALMRVQPTGDSRRLLLQGADR